MSHESIRPLFEDANAPSDLRSFVEMARQDGASQADLDRLAKRIAPVVGVSAALIASSAAAVATSAPVSAGTLTATAFGAPNSGLTAALSAASASKVGTGAGAVAGAKIGLFGQLMTSAAAKVLAVSLSVGAAGAALYSATRPERPSEPQVPAAAVEGDSARVAAAPRPAAEPIPSVTPAPEPSAPEQAAPTTAEAPVVAPPAARVAPAARVSARKASLPRETTPAAAPAVAAAAEEVRPPEQPITDQPVAAQAASEVAPPKPVLPPPSELSLIERAEALRARPNEALAFVAKHEEVYPHGALAQEREMLAIELLLKADKRSQAETRARRFESAYPHSAHLPHLRALLTRASAK